MRKRKEIMSKKDKMKILRDPNYVKTRIFIGNLPTCQPEEVESMCAAFGKIIASNVTKKFALINYETEESANKAAAALNNTNFKGSIIISNMARSKGEQHPSSNQSESASNNNNVNNNLSGNNNKLSVATPQAYPMMNNVSMALPNEPSSADLINDCEIIVIDRKNTKYAEYIEERLKALYLRVDVLFPNADVSLGKVLSSIFARGVLYAVLVTNQHEELQSITVNILYGHPAEHRNMPLEEAIALIDENFRKKIASEGRPLMPPPQPAPSISNYINLPKQVPIIAAPALASAPSLNDRHPESIQLLLNLLASNMPLTALQYDKIIKYLNERRELQMKAELGDYAPSPKESQPDPEMELQKKIKDIMSKPLVTENSHRLLYPNLKSVKEDPQIMNLLKDMKVQNALDMLMNTSLVANIESAMKF